MPQANGLSAALENDSWNAWQLISVSLRLTTLANRAKSPKQSKSWKTMKSMATPPMRTSAENVPILRISRRRHGSIAGMACSGTSIFPLAGSQCSISEASRYAIRNHSWELVKYIAGPVRDSEPRQTETSLLGSETINLGGCVKLRRRYDAMGSVL